MARGWSKLLCVVSLAAAACGSNPSPVTPPPAPSGVCVFRWDVEEGNGALDWYEVDVATEVWTTGEKHLGATARAFYVLGFDRQSLTIAAAGMTTAGAFSLSAAGMSTGAAAAFADVGGKTFFDATGLFQQDSSTLGPPAAFGGSGSFSGKLSSPDPSDAVSDGAGMVTIEYVDGRKGVFGFAGEGVQYSACFTAPG